LLFLADILLVVLSRTSLAYPQNLTDKELEEYFNILKINKIFSNVFSALKTFDIFSVL
jgi:hypothetical protein